MGFPSVCYCVILPQPLILVLQLLDFLRQAFFLCLFYLGITPTSAEEHPAATPASPDFFWAPAPATPSSAIKARLPVVRYADFPKRSSSCHHHHHLDGRPEPPAMCAVCLGVLEGRHKVRVLGNCSHAFHKGCIDKWVDKGQVTCPLCRALLLPN